MRGSRNFCQFYLVLSLFYSLKRGTNGFITEKAKDNYFTREAEIINDIVHLYDLDKDWFRIFTLERDIY